MSSLQYHSTHLHNLVNYSDGRWIPLGTVELVTRDGDASIHCNTGLLVPGEGEEAGHGVVTPGLISFPPLENPRCG